MSNADRVGSRVVESSTGAQILPTPRPADQRQRATTWSVWSCISADQRAKYPEYAALAARMTVERNDDER